MCCFAIKAHALFWSKWLTSLLFCVFCEKQMTNIIALFQRPKNLGSNYSWPSTKRFGAYAYGKLKHLLLYVKLHDSNHFISASFMCLHEQQWVLSTFKCLDYLTYDNSPSFDSYFFFLCKALLSGCSAGGLASFLHCQNFTNYLPENASVKCLSDAGFFLDK